MTNLKPISKKLCICLFILCITLGLKLKLFAQQSSQPNIVILFCDDLGYGDLSSYGHPTIRTPNLDRLAQQGTKFTQFYTGSSACTASRYSLLTGRYPIRSGFDWVLYPQSERGLHPEEITIAELLKEKGYATAIYGKWHLGTTQAAYFPTSQGFDEYLGLPFSNDMIPPHFDDIPFIHNTDTVRLNPDQTELTKLYITKAVDFIKNHKENANFVYVPFAMPHVPLFPGKDFDGHSPRGKYGDTVEELDWAAGYITAQIEKMDLDRNTLIFFTSDNGPWILKNLEGGSAGLLRDGKGSSWEGGNRVPAIAWWVKPDKDVQRIVTYPMSTLDLFASLVELGGAQIPKDRAIDGQSFVSILKGDPFEEKNDKVFFFYGISNRLMGVRKGKWKLHIATHSQIHKDYYNGKLPLLFDLETDPSESYDLSDQMPEKVKELQALIDKHIQDIGDKPSFFDQTK